MPLIKRYPNRKMYDTALKQYVTLDEIAEMIRQGEDVRVVDNASGDDLTALTLSQIILDQEKKQAGFLPRNVLTGLIQAGGDRLNALQRTLISTLALHRQIDEEIERRIHALVEGGDLTHAEGEHILGLLIQEGRANLEPKAYEEELVEKIISERNIPSQKGLQTLAEQLDELAKKLEEIEGHNDQS